MSCDLSNQVPYKLAMFGLFLSWEIKNGLRNNQKIYMHNYKKMVLGCFIERFYYRLYWYRLYQNRIIEKRKRLCSIFHILTPFNLDGRWQTVFSFSTLVLATRIFVVLWPLLRPTASSYLGFILQTVNILTNFTGCCWCI